MAELRIPIIVENKGKKALGDVDKGIKGLSKSFGKLAAAAGIGLSTAAIINFGKQAAKAFITDEKAASQLALSVKNLGLAFDLPAINGFIDKLSLSAGVADDKLRPSMQKLLQVTGSVSKSQELLLQALDISRASGIEYETVIQDLANAYVGNNKGLKKYNLGLTAAELKTMKFADAQEKLNKTFKGGSAAYLKTYAGQMEVLTVASGEASEKIGKGLVDALMILTGDTTVEDLSDKMLELADNTATALTNLGKFGKGVIDAFGPIATLLENFIINTQPFVDLIVEGNPAGFMDKPRTTARRFFAGGQDSLQFARDNAARKAAEAAAKAAKALAALQAKSLALQAKAAAEAKKKAALDKASKTLNLDAIGLEAALKGKISETDRISLLLQKAILEGNATLATQLSDQLEAAIKRNEQLRLALLSTPKAPNPYEDWKIPADLLAYTAATLGVSAETIIKAPETIGIGVTDATQELIDALIAAAEAQRKAEAAQAAAESGDVYVSVKVGEEDLSALITSSQTNSSLSGSFVGINRSGFKGAVAT